MKAINPYLNFDGNAEEAFTFYKSVFGGELQIMRYSDAPETESNKIDRKMMNKILHVSLPLSNGNVLMASDAPEFPGYKFLQGNNTFISISTDSIDETTRIFNALSEGGKIGMPLGNTFWGAYFGMFTDKYGVQWMISFDRQ